MAPPGAPAALQFITVQLVCSVHASALPCVTARGTSAFTGLQGCRLTLCAAHSGKASYISCRFMAPELLSSEAYPASDIWAAGVMAYQLLSGYLPFDDHRNPSRPALSVVWKSILTDPLSFKHACWASITDNAKDFIKTCLQRDWQDRPTALEGLKHPWLSAQNVPASAGAPLASNVVARMQHYARRCDHRKAVE